MRWEDFRRSGNVEDRRGSGGFGIPGRAGGLGLGTVLILALIGWALGIDPRLLIGGAAPYSAVRRSTSGITTEPRHCTDRRVG
jgi:uncharacterized protein